MITFFPKQHQLHCPEYEFFRGQKVPCFESPIRASYVHDELAKRGHDVRTDLLDSSDVLPQVHTSRYLKFLESAWQQWIELEKDNTNHQPFPSVWPVRSLRSDIEPDNFTAKLGLYSMDNGSPIVAGTWEAVKAAADAAFTAASLVSEGTRSAFAAVRPPGHHAGADFMGGYCYINNAAVAAQTLRNKGCERVAILDVDYHHGNGTQSIFYNRADVLVVNIHGDPKTEYPFYLGHADETGEGAGQGFNHNHPLPAGCSVDDWFAALDKSCKQINDYKPEALVISLGLDTYAGDPISYFALESDDFTRLGQRIHKLGLPSVFILEGGYATEALGINAANVIDGFES